MLGRFVDEEHLRHLFKKTIDFFEIVAQDSSSLAVDLKVLRGLQERLPRKEDMQLGGGAFFPFAQPPNDPSFPSNGPTPTPHSGPGPSPHADTNTPSEVGQPTPMDFS